MSEINWPITDPKLVELLGYKTMGSTAKRLIEEHTLIEGEDFEYEKTGYHRRLWHKKGAIKVAHKATSPKAKKFLSELGVDPQTKVSDEGITCDIICSALSGYTHYERNYKVDWNKKRFPYFLDLYLPDLKIAVECDEHDHQGYNQDEEQIRQQRIEEFLGCKFIRYIPTNPTAVGSVINQIFKHIVDPN